MAAAAAAGRAWARGALRAAWRGFASVPVKGSCSPYSSLAWAFQTRCSLSAPWTGTVEQCRKSSFFNTLTADQLWKGALAETGVGVKKGRGKKKKKKLRKNLNRGQEIGEGRSGFLWPGLNAPVLQTGRVQEVAQRKKEERERIQSEIIQQRDTFEKKKKIKIKREGGWSGKCWGGVILDPPDPGPNGETYEDFETRVIEETHQQLADQKSLYVVEFREEQGPLPIVVALPQGPVREEPEPEEEVPDTKLEWREVKEAQGMLKSPWARVRRAAC